MYRFPKGSNYELRIFYQIDDFGFHQTLNTNQRKKTKPLQDQKNNCIFAPHLKENAFTGKTVW